MKCSRGSHDRDHFQRIYQANIDPWDYRTSGYEKVKRETTIAALEGRRFNASLEVGCSIGLLTRRLADCCDRVLALDFIEAALVAARAACADRPNVSFQNVKVPIAWPEGSFDLIILSEVLYFLSSADNLSLVGRCQRSLASGGEILLVNWLKKSSDDPCSGDFAAKRFINAAKPYLDVILHIQTVGFRIDKLK